MFNFGYVKLKPNEQMKKVNQILILITIIALFFGCNKENSAISPGGSNSALVGKWKDGGTKGSITIDILGQKTTEPLDEPATNAIIEFKSDGTVLDLTALGDETKITKYKTSGSQLILTGTDNGKPIEFTFNYNISGKILLLTMDKALFQKNIKALSATGSDSELADLNEFLTLITDIKFEGTYEKI